MLYQPFQFFSDILNFLWIKNNYAWIWLFWEELFSSFHGFVEFFYFIFLSLSGPISFFTFFTEKVPFWQLLLFHFLVFIISIPLDYLTLNKISQKNLQNKKDKKSYNKSFIIFFILLRFCFLDLFVFSSLGAYFLNIKLSKKQILIISTIAQILRFLVFVIFYILYNWVYIG